MKKVKGSKGITLVALVITVIVLLILAGVTIAALSGDNGILTRAEEAKIKIEQATEKEQIQLAWNAVLANNTNKRVTGAKFEIELSNNNADIDFLAEDSSDIIIKFNNSNIYRVEPNGNISIEESYQIDHSEIIVSVIEKEGVFADNDNIKEVREGNIPIPNGFEYIKGDIIGGPVTTDGNSEFVWISVPKVTTDIAEGGTNLGENGVTPMAIKQGDNYIGLLYDFGNTGSKIRNTCIERPNKNYREPDNLSSIYDNITNIAEWTEILYQNEYNKMIQQVEQYGGFYVGRYETSFNGDIPQSKQGEISSTATENNQAWYGLYTKQKNYNKSNSVVSSMIYGSQYDAIMNWMVKNNIDISSKTPVDLSIGETTKNANTTTGTQAKDKLSNIYDLLGNSFEWTQEAYGTYGRVDFVK